MYVAVKGGEKAIDAATPCKRADAEAIPICPN